MTDAQKPSIKEREIVHAVLSKRSIFKVLIAYLIIVCLNAASLLALLWLQAFGLVSLPWQMYAALAVGTAGLGAGSLAFQAPIKTLFPN
jgi:hypothetical protein